MTCAIAPLTGDGGTPITAQARPNLRTRLSAALADGRAIWAKTPNPRADGSRPASPPGA